MNNKKNKLDEEWYDNPSFITNIMIGLLFLIIILSQSFAINNNLSTNEILRSLLNHNSIYLILLVYFISLKTHVGKKYFDYLNVFLVMLYTITSVTSLLTIFQSFSLISLISLAIHVVLLIYMFHVLFRSTNIWKDYKLDKSPFNEVTNDTFFYTILILSVILLTGNLIETATIGGAILSIFECFYYIIISRYIYLYRNYLEFNNKKNISSKEAK